MKPPQVVLIVDRWSVGLIPADHCAVPVEAACVGMQRFAEVVGEIRPVEQHVNDSRADYAAQTRAQPRVD